MTIIAWLWFISHVLRRSSFEYTQFVSRHVIPGFLAKRMCPLGLTHNEKCSHVGTFNPVICSFVASRSLSLNCQAAYPAGSFYRKKLID